MTAFVGNFRDTKQLAVDGQSRAAIVVGVKANSPLIQGTLTMIDASGRLLAAATATGQRCAGRVEWSYAAGASDGAVSATVQEGTFLWENSAAADQILADDIGKACYIVDNQTVALTDGTGTRSPAGIIRGILTKGATTRVWVETSLELSRLLLGS